MIFSDNYFGIIYMLFMEKIIIVKPPYIELGKLLKLISVVGTGGSAKIFLDSNDVKVNNIIERRRGRKLYSNDIVTIQEKNYKIAY
jgi:ribosome-associated protein